jgi:sRNA-binding carbon storage regulator CsrA
MLKKNIFNSLKWVVMIVLLIIVGYNIYTGVTVQKIGILGFYIEFNEPETAIILPPTTLEVGDKKLFMNNQISIKVIGIPGDTENVKIRIHNPENVKKEWNQGIGRELYKYDSNEYFVDILQLHKQQGIITSVTLQFSEKL